MLNFEYYHVRAERSENSKNIVVKGEIINRSDKNYSSITLRIIVFVKNVAIASVLVVINGLASGTSKAFQKNVEDLEYDAIAKEITRYDIYPESAY